MFLEGSDLPIFRSVRALLSTSAGSMGLDVPGTRLLQRLARNEDEEEEEEAGYLADLHL